MNNFRPKPRPISDEEYEELLRDFTEEGKWRVANCLAHSYSVERVKPDGTIIMYQYIYNSKARFAVVKPSGEFKDIILGHEEFELD